MFSKHNGYKGMKCVKTYGINIISEGYLSFTNAKVHPNTLVNLNQNSVANHRENTG